MGYLIAFISAIIFTTFVNIFMLCFSKRTVASRPICPCVAIKPLASSRRSVSRGAAQKTAREKIKKSAVSGSFLSPRIFISSRAVFYTAPWLTEPLEEAIKLLILRVNWKWNSLHCLLKRHKFIQEKTKRQFKTMWCCQLSLCTVLKYPFESTPSCLSTDS